jgi:hypothetical protein
MSAHYPVNDGGRHQWRPWLSRLIAVVSPLGVPALACLAFEFISSLTPSGRETPPVLLYVYVTCMDEPREELLNLVRRLVGSVTEKKLSRAEKRAIRLVVSHSCVAF